MLARNPITKTPTLTGLSALLRDQSQWPEGFEWNYCRWSQCAIGLAHAYWKDGDLDPPLLEAQACKVFGMKPSAFLQVFGGGTISDLPVDIADRIDAYLANRGD